MRILAIQLRIAEQQILTLAANSRLPVIRYARPMFLIADAFAA
jgi:hypothetical protein